MYTYIFNEPPNDLAKYLEQQKFLNFVMVINLPQYPSQYDSFLSQLLQCLSLLNEYLSKTTWAVSIFIFLFVLFYTLLYILYRCKYQKHHYDLLNPHTFLLDFFVALRTFSFGIMFCFFISWKNTHFGTEKVFFVFFCWCLVSLLSFFSSFWLITIQ